MTMESRSRTRRLLGSAGIFGGTAAALVLTATVSYAIIPAPDAPDAPTAPEAPGWTDDGFAEAPQAPPAPRAPLAPEAPRAPGARTEHRTVVVTRGEDGKEFRSEIVASDEHNLVTHDRSEDSERIVMRRRDGSERHMVIGDCEGQARNHAFITQSEVTEGKTVKTKVVTCGDIMPDRAEIMAHAMQGMVEARRRMAEMPHFSADDRAEMLAEFDSGMAELRREMQELHSELP